MTGLAPDAEQTPAAQLPPWLRRPREPLGWVGLSVLVAVASVVMLAVGILAAALAIVAWAVRGVVWMVMTVVDWAWFLGHELARREYPFTLRPPTDEDARATVVNDAWVATLPRAIGLAARTAGFLFAPIALLASLVGIVLPSLRARPYVALFNVPSLEAKLVGIGRNHGYFDDGRAVAVLPYEAYLRESFPQRADFLAWWRDVESAAEFRPENAMWDTPRHFSGLRLGPYPDALGMPGLALTAIKRTRIDGLRELFISQREIDDLGDPNLDDRADVAVIRIVQVGDADHRRWIVQLPSTQTWHPRAGRAPNDLTADFVALSMQETTLTRAADEAMRQAGIREGEPVLVAGFSLGGMVAAQLASRQLAAENGGFTVTHLVTAGAPIGRYRFEKTLRVFSIEHVLDSVPRLEGRENPIIVEHRGAGIRSAQGAAQGQDAAEWLTVKAGPPLPLGYRIAVTHHSPSYAETAGSLEQDPPAPEVADYLSGIRPFFDGEQVVDDFAAYRSGVDAPRPAVPMYLHSTVGDGITRDQLRTTLRRVPGVVAVDIYQSRTGFPTTILWSADVLVHSLRPWFEEVERASVYAGLLTLLSRERAIGLHLRLQAKRTPGVTWEATLQRMADGRWRERVDVGFDSDAARDEWSGLLMPGGWASRVTYYDPAAF